MKRFVFMISDGTGITVQSLSKSLLTQFDNLEFETVMLPYIDTLDKANAVVLQINDCYTQTQTPPLVFITLVNPEISAILHQAQGCFFDLFNNFIKQLEHALGQKASDTIGRAHGLADSKAYEQRIEAVHYALAYDDGIKPSGYDKADIILIGVSRCGKTPSCLYMALSFGIFAANYPFVEENLEGMHLPDTLKPYKQKLFGLTIDAERLQHIRTERCPNTRYASLEQCRREISEVETMYQKERIPYINSTRYSIEEITTKIMSIAKLERRL